MMRQLVGDDVCTILEYFEELDDPRSSINRKHLLGDLIVISVCGVIAGADGPNAIGVWAKSNRGWLQNHLELPYGIPSHDTIGRLLAALKPAGVSLRLGGQTWFSVFIMTCSIAFSRLRYLADSDSLRLARRTKFAALSG